MVLTDVVIISATVSGRMALIFPRPRPRWRFTARGPAIRPPGAHGPVKPLSQSRLVASDHGSLEGGAKVGSSTPCPSANHVWWALPASVARLGTTTHPLPFDARQLIASGPQLVPVMRCSSP